MPEAMAAPLSLASDVELDSAEEEAVEVDARL